MEHKLHKKIGVALSKIKADQIVLDEACGGQQQISLFMEKVKNRQNRICKVDAAIIQKDTIKVIVEIEESGFNPTKICGKYLTSVLSERYIRDNENIPLSNKEVLFIQIINATNFTPEKKEQMHLISNRLKQLHFKRLFSYSLFLMEKNEGSNEIEKIFNYISTFLLESV